MVAGEEAVRMLRAVCFALLSGCTSSLSSVQPDSDSDADADTDADADGDADSDSDSDADSDRVVIRKVEPASGSNAGGYEATLTGGPFDASARVVFVGPEATASADIVSVAEDALIVDVPASIDVGSVDVRVTTDTGTGTKEDAFKYFADGTGKYGLVGGVEWYEVVGDYWSQPPPRSSGTAYAFFVEPQAAGYVELYFTPHRGADSCVSDYWNTAENDANWDGMASLDPANESLKLASEDHPPIALLPSDADDDYDGTPDSPWFYSTALMPEDYVSLQTYNLMPIDIGGDLPRFSLEAVAKTPEPLVLTLPAIDGATVPSVRRAMQLAWETPTTPDPSYLVAMLYRRDIDTGEVVEDVTCYIRDDGAFTIPGTTWGDWPEGAQIDIYVGRVTESSAVLPYNNARSGLVGAYYLQGAAFAVP